MIAIIPAPATKKTIPITQNDPGGCRGRSKKGMYVGPALYRAECARTSS